MGTGSMKHIRNDAAHASPAPLDNERPDRLHSGDANRLSAKEAGYGGRRVSQLDDAQREAVANDALAGASGSLPYRVEMEAQFGRSFGDVRVADSDQARQSLASVGADGVSRDKSVAFREPSPSRKAVAHELTHVAQAELGGGASRGHAEQEAFRVEGQLGRGGPVGVSSGVGAGIAHFRDPDDSLADLYGMQAQPAFSPFTMQQNLAVDERNPIDWRMLTQAPPDPFELVDCTVKSHPPQRPKDPAEAREDRCHPGHHQRDDRFDEPVWPQLQRQQFWSAFETGSMQAQSAHDMMANDVGLFRNAERDEQLQALGFVMNKGFKGDMATLAEQQQVPQRGGAAVGALFDGNQDLKLSKHDQRAIDQTASNAQKGKGKIDDAMLDTIAADNGVKEALSTISGATDGVMRGASLLRAAHHAIEFEKYADAADDARAEIQELQDEVKQKKDVVAAITGLASGIVFAAGGDLGDAINQVGVVAGIVLDYTSDDKMKVLEAKLRGAKQGMKTERAAELSARLAAANRAVSQALHTVAAAKSNLLQALTQRRKAYNAAGRAAGAQVDAPDSRHKVAGILSAIPIVEIVVGRARAIAQKATAPAYTKDAGHGLAMAAYHGWPVATSFMRACGELNYCKTYFGTVAADWQDRLDALLEVKERIGGSRPQAPPTSE